MLNATINLYTYCTIEEIAEDEIVINSYDASCFKNYHLSESLEIDGEAFLIKGVYNRIIRDYHSLHITMLLLAPVSERPPRWSCVSLKPLSNGYPFHWEITKRPGLHTRLNARI